MSTAVKIWEIVKDSLHPVTDDSFAENYYEKNLEAWIEHEPSILGDRVLIIGRQKDIPSVSVIDLLGIDQDGTLVIIELKRKRTPREAVAQALDYASWLYSADELQIEGWAEEYLKQPLKEKFCEYFAVDADDVPELSCQKHRIVLAAPRLDASAERIINYLSQKYDVQINAVFFQYACLSDKKEILARAMLVAEAPIKPNRPRRITVDELVKTANDQGTTDLVKICRGVRDLWNEEAVPISMALSDTGGKARPAQIEWSLE
jgi:Endonuclease NucS